MTFARTINPDHNEVDGPILKVEPVRNPDGPRRYNWKISECLDGPEIAHGVVSQVEDSKLNLVTKIFGDYVKQHPPQGKPLVTLESTTSLDEPEAAFYENGRMKPLVVTLVIGDRDPGKVQEVQISDSSHSPSDGHMIPRRFSWLIRDRRISDLPPSPYYLDGQGLIATGTVYHAIKDGQLTLLAKVMQDYERIAQRERARSTVLEQATTPPEEPAVDFDHTEVDESRNQMTPNDYSRQQRAMLAQKVHQHVAANEPVPVDVLAHLARPLSHWENEQKAYLKRREAAPKVWVVIGTYESSSYTKVLGVYVDEKMADDACVDFSETQAGLIPRVFPKEVFG